MLSFRHRLLGRKPWSLAAPWESRPKAIPALGRPGKIGAAKGGHFGALGFDPEKTRSAGPRKTPPNAFFKGRRRPRGPPKPAKIPANSPPPRGPSLPGPGGSKILGRYLATCLEDPGDSRPPTGVLGVPPSGARRLRSISPGPLGFHWGSRFRAFLGIVVLIIT